MGNTQTNNNSDKIYFQNDSGVLYCGDCFEILPELAVCADMVLTDPPYNNTKCGFDKKKMKWRQFFGLIKSAVKETGIKAVFSQEPLASRQRLIAKDYRYQIVMCKKSPLGFLDANIRPLRAHEVVLIFCEKWRGQKNAKTSMYNPQFWFATPYMRQHRDDRASHYGQVRSNLTDASDGRRYPLDWQIVSNSNYQSLHPTQKPVDFLEGLIKTYTNEGELVIDPFAGSSTTAVAAMKTGRRWICIEKEEKYCEASVKRILQETERQKQESLSLFKELPN